MTDTHIIEQEAKVVAIDPQQGGIAQQLAFRILNSPDASVESLREVLKMQNEQEDRQRRHIVEDRKWEAELAFNTAFTDCKEVMPQVAKDSYNEQTRSHYATVEAVDLAITPVMSQYGFAITFKEGKEPIDEKHAHVIAILIHAKGHREIYESQVPIAGVGTKGTRMMTHTHGYGATKTYARRYAKLDIWDVAVMDKDSDGNVNNVSFDTSPWTQKILDAPDMAALQSIADSLNNSDVPISALTMIRAAWAGRAAQIQKELKDVA